MMNLVYLQSLMLLLSNNNDINNKYIFNSF